MNTNKLHITPQIKIKGLLMLKIIHTFNTSKKKINYKDPKILKVGDRVRISKIQKTFFV